MEYENRKIDNNGEWSCLTLDDTENNKDAMPESLLRDTGNKRRQFEHY